MLPGVCPRSCTQVRLSVREPEFPVHLLPHIFKLGGALAVLGFIIGLIVYGPDCSSVVRNGQFVEVCKSGVSGAEGSSGELWFEAIEWSVGYAVIGGILGFGLVALFPGLREILGGGPEDD